MREQPEEHNDKSDQKNAACAFALMDRSKSRA
jgi:hypothetical protein